MNLLNAIYNRTISVYRQPIQSDMQYEDYTPQLVENLSDLPASIQFQSITGKPSTGLPTDASNETYYNIFIPFGQNQASGFIANNLIFSRDQIMDDRGAKYEVNGVPEWDVFGYNVRCKLLQP